MHKMAAIITWPDPGRRSVCSLQFNPFLGQTITASNHMWCWSNPQCHQAETLSPTPNQSFQSSADHLASCNSNKAGPHLNMSNETARWFSYNMALGLGDKVGVMWPGIIWLILSTYHNKYQSSHKWDNTQVRTSFQQVTCLVIGRTCKSWLSDQHLGTNTS